MHQHYEQVLYVLEGGVSDEWQSVEGWHGFIHQRVRFDEVERHFGQGARVVDALTGTWLWNLIGIHWQPISIHRSLLLYLVKHEKEEREKNE